MSATSKLNTLRELQRIPGVGLRVAEDLWNLGFRSVNELKDQDPEALYQRLCQQQRHQVDRCMLYVLRCAVYYASNISHERELLKWWNWSDMALQPQS
ncbi:MAG: helix-hairpin-helix domain-containing protein [Anaerolineae bacterium]|nr:helix-hairpin-helix domain-containing protein [Anaerolineae bacterium]